METNNLAATAPEQTTAAPEVSDSAPEQTASTETAPVETPKQETEPEWFTKRFGEITAKYRETERERDYLRQQLQLREQQQQAPKPDAAKPKTLADFDYDFGRLWESEGRRDELKQIDEGRACWCTHVCFIHDSMRHSRRAQLYDVPKNYLTRESW